MTAPAVTGEVHVRPVEYLVTIWPDGHECTEAAHWSLLVIYRGHGKWAIEQGWGHGDKLVLTRSGQWDLDKRGDPACRFTLDEALGLSRQHAATLTITGHTAAQVMKEHLKKRSPG